MAFSRFCWLFFPYLTFPHCYRVINLPAGIEILSIKVKESVRLRSCWELGSGITKTIIFNYGKSVKRNQDWTYSPPSQQLSWSFFVYIEVKLVAAINIVFHDSLSFWGENCCWNKVKNQICNVWYFQQHFSSLFWLSENPYTFIPR